METNRKTVSMEDLHSSTEKGSWFEWSQVTFSEVTADDERVGK